MNIKASMAGALASATVHMQGAMAQNADVMLGGADYFGDSEPGDDLGGVALRVDGQMDAVAKGVTAGLVVLGLSLVGVGLLKLKAASDSQGREPYAPGLWRLGVGAGLVGLSQTVTTLRNTIFGDASASSMSAGGAVTISR